MNMKAETLRYMAKSWHTRALQPSVYHVCECIMCPSVYRHKRAQTCLFIASLSEKNWVLYYFKLC